ncbi:hypothetical protein lerEdw1_015966 [Lerista edwardsae]|nr:hypothetical protein lerEdw1_015966 [Lerista edwardsae]
MAHLTTGTLHTVCGRSTSINTAVTITLRIIVNITITLECDATMDERSWTDSLLVSCETHLRETRERKPGFKTSDCQRTESELRTRRRKFPPSMDVTSLAPIVEALPLPTLSVHPRHPTYFEGERVDLVCSAPPNGTAEGYRFFNQSGGLILEMAPNAYQQGKLAFHIQMDSTGTYTCDYWMGREVMKIISAKSNIIALQVKAPFLSLSPSLDAYRWEDMVSLTCSAPPETPKVKEFQYYGDRQVTLAVASSPVYVRNLSLKEPRHVGPFQCAYVQKHFGRPVVSKKSNLVLINVRDGTCFGSYSTAINQVAANSTENGIWYRFLETLFDLDCCHCAELAGLAQSRLTPE